MHKVTSEMKRLLSILIFLFFSITSYAQNHDAELISQITEIKINKGKLIKNLYYEIKINNRAGEKYTKIAIPFSKLVNSSNIEAYIKDTEGRVVKKLNKSNIVEKSSISDFSLYEDDYIKEFTLKHNVYPYTIVYSYQIQQKEFLYIDYWIPVIDINVPTRQATLELSIPIDYEIAHKQQFVDKPVIDTTENEIIFQWKATYTDIVNKEVHSPPLSDFLPVVQIVPQKFLFATEGSFKDWKAFGNWQYDLLQGLNELPFAEKNKIQSLVANIQDDKEKIRTLYHYLQDETRYVNVTIETGGLKPYPAAYVVHNKYGDCKALTNYFKSILDYIKIPSYYTNVYAGRPTRVIDKDFPAQQSNHVILYIPLKDEDIWLDCTSDAAFNYLGTFTQNRDALLICKDSSRFVKTPGLKAIDNLEVRNIEISPDASNPNVRFSNTYKGSKYEEIFYLGQNYSDTDKSRILRNYITEEGFQLMDYEISDSHRDSAVIRLSYNAVNNNIYKHYGNNLLISNVAFTLPDFEKPQKRKLPVQLDFPIYKVDTITYEIPDEYKLERDSVAFSVSTKYGDYSLNVFKSSNRIVTIKSLLINAGYYPVSEYGDFYNFYSQIVESEGKTHISLSK